MSVAWVPTEDIKPGVVVVFLGTPHLIERVEPYTGPLHPDVTHIARAGDGWGISLTEGRGLFLDTPVVAS